MGAMVGPFRVLGATELAVNRCLCHMSHASNDASWRNAGGEPAARSDLGSTIARLVQHTVTDQGYSSAIHAVHIHGVGRIDERLRCLLIRLENSLHPMIVQFIIDMFVALTLTQQSS